MKIKFFIICFSLFVYGCVKNDNHSNTKNQNPEFEWVKIPAGEYVLGGENSIMNPIHIVNSGEFYISPNEITNEQFKQFIDETNYFTTAEKYKNAKTFHVGLGEFEWVQDSTANWRFPFGEKNGGIENKMNYPVTCISFIDIQAYCKWAGVRLPTLDEWEIASRCGSRDKYFFGKDSTLLYEYANIWLSKTHDSLNVEDEFLFHSPIETFKPNKWGLYDMYGNNFEFCSDQFLQLKNNPRQVCARGGSWWCSKNSCNFFNSVDIGSVNKMASFSNHGFRIVKLKEN
jgi:sulfatase modifying factor 1